VTWILRTRIQLVRGRVLVSDLDSDESQLPEPLLPPETPVDRRRCPPFQGCPVSAVALLLPCDPGHVWGASTLKQVALHVYWERAEGHPRGYLALLQILWEPQNWGLSPRC